MENLKHLVRTWLHCGDLSLQVLENVGYDWWDIFEYRKDHWDEPIEDFNDLMRTLFDFGVDQIENEIYMKTRELTDGTTEEDLSEEEKRELAVLRSLNPCEDFEQFHNWGLDTHIWCVKNGAFYEEYLSDELDCFHSGTGFVIEGLQ